MIFGIFTILFSCWAILCILAIDDTICCWSKIPKKIRHYIIFMHVQKRLLGKYKYYFHDVDKILMYMFIPFVGNYTIQENHKKNKKHHIALYKRVDEVDYVEAIIDYESYGNSYDFVIKNGELFGETHFYNLRKILIELNLYK